MTAFYKVQPITDFGIFTTPEADRKSPQFKASWSTTVRELEDELWHLDAYEVVLEIGVSARDIRLDGQLRADAKPTHPGVRVSFQTSRRGDLSFTCDTYEQQYGWLMPSWQANVRAIVKTLVALRAVDRYGATQGEQYAGFKALPAGSGGIALGGITRDDAAATLAMHGNVPYSEILEHKEAAQVAFKTARASVHPDRNGGSRKDWDAVEAAAKVLGVLS